MTEFSNKRFIDIGQQVFLNALKDTKSQKIFELVLQDKKNPGYLNDYLEIIADYSFQAAEKFAETFRHIEE